MRFSDQFPIATSAGAGADANAIPWFKRYRPEAIAQHAAAFRKAAEHYEELLADDPGDPPQLGSWHFFTPQ